MRSARILVASLLVCAQLSMAALATAVAPIYGGFEPGLLDYQGTLGTTRIGLTFAVDGNPMAHGSYFYFKYLKDIPLKGTFQPDGFALREYDSSGKITGTFHLKISTEDVQKIEKPLALSNTSVLVGTWTSADGSRTLPVELRQMAWMSGSEGNRYGEFGSEVDIERKVRQFYDAVQQGNREAAANAVDYPLRINSLHLSIRDKQQFLAHYTQIFTPAFVRCLANYPPHNLFVNAQGIMLGRGELWFNEKGVVSVNPCTAH
ncbi:MAG: hypothetical protein WA400_01405 [Silvibacterium sp.]